MKCEKCKTNVEGNYAEIDGVIYCLACASEMLVNRGIKGNFGLLGIKEDPGEK